MPELGQAAELRAAAKLMRERAEAATPGPWWSDESDQCWRLHGVAFRIPPQCDGLIPEQLVNAQILKAPKCGTPYAEYWPVAADAAQITSWHPLVALAVADLLDAMAADSDPFPVRYPAALDLARAYLGEGEPR